MSEKDWTFDLVLTDEGDLLVEASVSPKQSILRGLSRKDIWVLDQSIRKALREYPVPVRPVKAVTP